MTHTERSHKIEHMLDAVESSLDARKQVSAFIESLRDQFDRRGDLSDKQISALENFYDRID